MKLHERQSQLMKHFLLVTDFMIQADFKLKELNNKYDEAVIEFPNGDKHQYRVDEMLDVMLQWTKDFDDEIYLQYLPKFRELGLAR